MSELQNKLKEISTELGVLEIKEGRTAEDETRIDALVVEFKEVKDKAEKDEARNKEMEAVRKTLTTVINMPPKPDIKEEGSQFRSFGEFIQTVVYNPADSRLIRRSLPITTGKEKRDLTFGTQGAILVPDQFISMIKQVNLGEAVVRPRASVIPAGDIPDQGVEMPALDQTAADGSGLYGGIKVVWTAEGVPKTETDTDVKLIELDPKEVAGWIELTDKLLRNAPAIDTLIGTLFRGAISASEEVEFLAGTNPATRPTGIVGHAGTIGINRGIANRILYADLVNMFASSFGLGLVWVAAKSALPQLMTMKDFEAADSDAPNLVFHPDARTGILGSLLGLPLLYTDLTPTIGNPGDLMLANFPYYLIKDGYGVEVRSDMGYTNFKSNRTTIKAFWNVDGKPWLTAPIILRDAVTQVSPFVILDDVSVSS
jgi:HK97 family phage major capsid protein